MEIARLSLENFRNYERAEFLFSSGINVIHGENAAGKTNALEAVYYLTGARSFRPVKDRDLIREEQRFSLVEGEIKSFGRLSVIRAELSGERRRKLSINGAGVKILSELSGRFLAVLFSPSDLELVKEGAVIRRRFLDLCFSQLRPKYAKTLHDYNRCLLQKTRILRDCREHPGLLKSLPDFNRQLSELGAVLIAYRALFIEKIGEISKEYHREISGGRETMEAAYAPTSPIEAPKAPVPELALRLYNHMETMREAELSARSALTGPHKDDLHILIDGRPARLYASQGQMRTAALSLKLAERELLKRDTGETPVLLLDDVLSELDEGRRDFVLSKIEGGQVIITLCDERSLPGDTLKKFHVKHGNIEA